MILPISTSRKKEAAISTALKETLFYSEDLKSPLFGSIFKQQLVVKPTNSA